MEYMIGQKVIYRDRVGDHIYDVICTVCIPENEGNFGVWIYNPAREYKHSVSIDNIKPYHIETAIYHKMIERIKFSIDSELAKDLIDIINGEQ